MNLTTLRRNLEFWDRFAPWYTKWADRGSYHAPLISEIAKICEPEWNVLDIGAATGVLSIPLAALGCRVHALEPSAVMRFFLEARLDQLNLEKVIEPVASTWEAFIATPGMHYDLALACNSLHLTMGGIPEGMKKIFRLGARHVLLITEINQSIFIDFKSLHYAQTTYEFQFLKTFDLDSSFRFEDEAEVYGLQNLLGRPIQAETNASGLVEKEGVQAAVVLWEKMNPLAP